MTLLTFTKDVFRSFTAKLDTLGFDRLSLHLVTYIRKCRNSNSSRPRLSETRLKTSPRQGEFLQKGRKSFKVDKYANSIMGRKLQRTLQWLKYLMHSQNRYAWKISRVTATEYILENTGLGKLITSKRAFFSADKRFF